MASAAPPAAPSISDCASSSSLAPPKPKPRAPHQPRLCLLSAPPPIPPAQLARSTLVNPRVLLVARLACLAFLLAHFALFLLDASLPVASYAAWNFALLTAAFLLIVVCSLLDVIFDDVSSDGQDDLHDADDLGIDTRALSARQGAAATESSLAQEDSTSTAGAFLDTDLERQQPSPSAAALSEPPHFKTTRPLATKLTRVAAPIYAVAVVASLYGALLFFAVLRLPLQSGRRYETIVRAAIAPALALLDLVLSGLRFRLRRRFFAPFVLYHALFAAAYAVRVFVLRRDDGYEFLAGADAGRSVGDVVLRTAALAFGAVLAAVLLFVVTNLRRWMAMQRVAAEKAAAAAIEPLVADDEDEEEEEGESSGKLKGDLPGWRTSEDDDDGGGDDQRARKPAVDADRRGQAVVQETGDSEEEFDTKPVPSSGDGSSRRPMSYTELHDRSSTPMVNKLPMPAMRRSRSFAMTSTLSRASDASRNSGPDRGGARAGTLLRTWSMRGPSSLVSSAVVLRPSRSRSSSRSHSPSAVPRRPTRVSSWQMLESPSPRLEDTFFKMPAVLETQGLERDVIRLPAAGAGAVLSRAVSGKSIASGDGCERANSEVVGGSGGIRRASSLLSFRRSASSDGLAPAPRPKPIPPLRMADTTAGMAAVCDAAL